MGTFVQMPDVVSISGGFSDSRDFVAGRFDLVNSYAAQSFTITQDYINSLTTLLNELTVPATDALAIDSPEITPIDYAARPALARVALPSDWPVNSSTPPALQPFPAFADVTMPVMTFAPPDWTAYAAPVIADIGELADMPQVNPVAMPTAPSITLPSPPAFDSIAIPASPDVSVPLFDAVLPSDTLDNPAPFAWGEPAYLSDLWSDLLAKVLGDIKNGGTGLAAAVEAELYQRHLDRTRDENERLHNETNDYFAARGWTMPPGMLSGRLLEINQQISRNNLNASRDITISQAELAQKNTQFIVEQGAKLEGMLREFYTQNTNRAFEAAKYAAENAIGIYNAMAAGVTLKLERYKAEAAAYEARVRAVLAQVEVFKGQVEAAKVTADVQRTMADVYRSQLLAAETYVKLYVSEMEGAKIAAEIEMTKLEQFKAMTQAYIARLDVEKSKLDVYEQQVRSEGVKAETYRSQVQAYAAEVQAAQGVLDVQLKKMQAVLEQNRAEIDRYKAELSAYETETRAKASEIAAVVDGFQAETAAYNAETQAQAANYSVRVEEIRARIAEATFRLQKATAEIEAVARGYVAIKELQVKGTEGIMNVGAQLTASALNAVNASTSFGFSGSGSNSQSWSHGESISESHNYEEL